MTTTMTERGRTIVPAGIRRRHGLGAHSKLEWIEDGGSIRVVPLPADTLNGSRGLFKGCSLRDALLRSRREDGCRE